MLVRQMLRENVYLAVGYFVLMQVSLAAAVFYWPELRENIPVIMKLIPFAKMQSWVSEIEKVGFWPYFVVQQFFKGCSLFGLAAAAMIGSGLIAREADNNTAEFLLSRPVSRRRILVTRWAVGAGLVSVPVFVSSLLGMACAALIGENMALLPVLAGSVYLSLFLLVLFTVTVWMSAGFTHQLKAGAILVFVMLLQFALYLVKVLGNYSAFALVDHDMLIPLEKGQYPWVWSVIFVLVSAGLLELAVRRFQRRDF